MKRLFNVKQAIFSSFFALAGSDNQVTEEELNAINVIYDTMGLSNLLKGERDFVVHYWEKLEGKKNRAKILVKVAIGSITKQPYFYKLVYFKSFNKYVQEHHKGEAAAEYILKIITRKLGIKKADLELINN